MKKLKWLVIHCTASPEGTDITPARIKEWHCGPRDLPDGRVRYMRKTYNSRNELPNDMINCQPISTIKGNGWSVVGYAKMIALNGKVYTLVPYDDDQYIEPWEITNGVRGINGAARHFVYAGGTDRWGKPKDTRTQQQLIVLSRLIFEEVQNNPDILVAGHRQFANKACPSFDTVEFCKNIGLPEKNIYHGRNS
ncbi:N-acetylmuramoyl-L-alanine amidase [Bacteroidales bacterium AH-315-I05]|nr:N-acetylmuramoyl-L-alanine amidase [Bacteroidales bacterium AH-315-I05]